MELPNLDLIVDTFVKINDTRLDSYILQLRNEVISEIRKLEKQGKIIWYSFLIHDHTNLGGRVQSTDINIYVHLRLGLPDGADVNQFISQLPSHFQEPVTVSLSKIAGIDVSIMRNEDWAYAWKIHGEASEWVVNLLEGHDTNSLPIQQVIQFMHFITNPLMLGHRCLCIPAGFLSF